MHTSFQHIKNALPPCLFVFPDLCWIALFAGRGLQMSPFQHMNLLCCLSFPSASFAIMYFQFFVGYLQGKGVQISSFLTYCEFTKWFKFSLLNIFIHKNVSALLWYISKCLQDPWHILIFLNWKDIGLKIARLGQNWITMLFFHVLFRGNTRLFCYQLILWY